MVTSVRKSLELPDPTLMTSAELEAEADRCSEMLKRLQAEFDRRARRKIRPLPDENSGAPWFTFTDDGLPIHARWVDHSYVMEKDTRKDFVSEPYSLYGGDFEELAALERKGWEIYVTAREARWNPGNTVVVRLHKEET
jgi:hypothetical protein